MILLLTALGLLLGSGLLALALGRHPRAALAVGAAGAVAGGLAGLVPAAAALTGAAPAALELPWSAPGGSLSLGVDPLTAVFLVPVFALSALFAIYGFGYLAPYAGRKPLGPPAFFYNLLAASMALVLTARNAVLFLAAWETMSLASFFLVAFEDEKPEVRAASRVYFVAMHLGSAFLLALFGLLGRDAGSLSFAAFAATPFPTARAGLFFALALVGFGTKAGFWPLHVWLPKAHPAAPSHVSALMSGVMIKTGLYGVCRTVLLLGPPRPAWGLALLAVGATSGVLGILCSLAQRDLKALLAYCSEENVGIITLGLGVGVLAAAEGQPAAAAAGFAGALLHVWNHGLFKGLLFLGAGSVAHAAHTRDLERLGGLWKRMPATAGTFLVGAAAISGLPPLNGLASEFLIYLGFLRAGTGIAGLPALASLTGAAVLALVGGLALAAFAKAVGAAFLGEPRSEAARSATDAGGAMRFPMGLLAGLCFAVGLAPWLFVGLLAPAVAQLAPGAGAEAAALAAPSGPLVRLGCASLGILLLILAVLALRRLLLRGRPIGESPTWDCGFHAPSARMQYSASSFAEPLTSLFRPVLGTRTQGLLPRGHFPSGGAWGTYALDVADARVWLPFFRTCGDLFGRLRFLQRGHVQAYLISIFVTLVALLVWALAS